MPPSAVPPPTPEEVLAECARHARNLTAGDFSSARELYRLTDAQQYPAAIAAFAEAFGTMAVKLEARELALAETVAQLQRDLKLRADFTFIFINTILIISGYVFLVMLGRLFREQAELLSRLTEFATLMSALALMRRVDIPRREFGLNLDGWWQSLTESLAVSTLLIGILFAVRAACIQSGTAFHGEPLLTGAYLTWFIPCYLLVAPLQEFLMRGITQTAFQRVMQGRHHTAWAIILSSVLFAVVHLQYSVKFAVLAFIPSVIWGILYQRRPTLLGVSVSHFLVGSAVLALGFWDLLSA